MELFQVRYFLALAKTLNFTRAAQACNVTQPALTRAIQRLESEFGGPLLYRERSLTQLTELGRAVLPQLEALYLAAETATAEAEAFRRREVSPLRVGLNQTISARLLTPVLQELQLRMPDFELSLEEGSTSDLVSHMLDGKIDAALLPDTDGLPERLNRWSLFEDRYVILSPSDHRFGETAEVAPTALADECLIERTRPGCEFVSALDQICAEAGVKPRARHRGASDDQIHHMVRAGLGVALSAEHLPAPGDLVARPIAGKAACRSVIVAAVAGRSQGPGQALFLKLMRARDWAARDRAPQQASLH